MGFDVSPFINWVQLGMWLLCALNYLQPGLLARMKIPIMSRLRFFPILICAGILFSGYSLYAQYLKKPLWKITEVISGRTFVNETIKTDGRGFNRCVFENVTFLYEGNGPTYCHYCEVRGKNYFGTGNPAVGTAMDFMKLLLDNPHANTYSFGTKDKYGNKIPLTPEYKR